MTEESSAVATQFIPAAILGGVVGDALGVPVEFTSRASLKRYPVETMRGYGTHNQPPGTWSDDSSLAFCLAESLAEVGLNYHDQAERFVAWMNDGEWTPQGYVFDIGNATREAILRLDAGVEPTTAGLCGDRHCGNGSLMRILPLGLYLACSDQQQRVIAAAECGRLTHGHGRCQLACVMFTEIVAALVQGQAIEDAVTAGHAVLERMITERFPDEAAAFERLLNTSIIDWREPEVSSSGYVIHCLEASLWCALRATSYREGVLEAVNLGDDTDTTGTVAGALLALRFGQEQIPADWIDSLARLADIQQLIASFQQACVNRWQADASNNN